MKKEFCDGCGIETTDQQETGTFLRKCKTDDISGWELKNYDLCEICASKTDEFIQSLSTSTKS